jgi:thiol-disulfide isomerase/thioredoxin
MKRLFLPLLLFTGTVFAGADYFEDISLKDALVKAKDQNKVVFVDFYTTWCGPCKMLDKNTFPDANVKQWLTDNTIPLKIDAEEQVELAKQYKVSGYPYLAFINADGELRSSSLGYLNPEQFIKEANRALSGKSPLQIAREALAKDPSFQNHLALAKTYAQQEDFDQALDTLKQVMADGKAGKIEGFKNMGVLINLARISRRHEATKNYLNELSGQIRDDILNNGAQEGFTDLAIINSMNGNSGATLAIYDKIKEANPNDERLMMFGTAVFSDLKNQHRYAEIVAIEEVDKRIEKIQNQAEEMKANGLADQVDSVTIRGLSDQYEILMGLDRQEEAEKVATQILEISQDSIAYNSLAWSGFLSGKSNATTLDYARKADDLSEHKNVAIIDTLARVLHATGQKDEAYKVLDERLAMFTKKGRERSILEDCLNDLKKEDSEAQKQG